MAGLIAAVVLTIYFQRYGPAKSNKELMLRYAFIAGIVVVLIGFELILNIFFGSPFKNFNPT